MVPGTSFSLGSPVCSLFVSVGKGIAHMRQREENEKDLLSSLCSEGARDSEQCVGSRLCQAGLCSYTDQTESNISISIHILMYWTCTQ